MSKLLNIAFFKLYGTVSFRLIIWALAQEGDYKMHPVRACVRALVCHADFSKTTTATDSL